jgi:hypothetical protein
MSAYVADAKARAGRTTKDIRELVTNGTQELPTLLNSVSGVLLGGGERVLSLLLCSLGAGVRGRKARRLETGPQGLDEAKYRSDHGVAVDDSGQTVWYAAVCDGEGGDGDELSTGSLEKGESRERPSHHVSYGGNGRLLRPTFEDAASHVSSFHFLLNLLLHFLRWRRISITLLTSNIIPCFCSTPPGCTFSYSTQCFKISDCYHTTAAEDLKLGGPRVSKALRLCSDDNSHC